MFKEPGGLDEALPGESPAAPAAAGAAAPAASAWQPGQRLDRGDPARSWKALRLHLRETEGTNHAGRKLGGGTTSKARQARRAAARVEQWAEAPAEAAAWADDSWGSWAGWHGSWHEWPAWDWREDTLEKGEKPDSALRSRTPSRGQAWSQQEAGMA